MHTQRYEILEYVKEKYGTEPDYLFEKDPGHAILRHPEKKGKRKWYGLILDVPWKALHIQKDGYVDILNVKASPDMVEFLKHQDGFLPAYHMNKNHWISIVLDDVVPFDIIMKCLDESYYLTK
ncbi:MAG: MmcQ/YjbR family DNA-binding protein [Bacillota bacterium]|nr:MmcQ/YjbR family DNA-binding protein [Bacillota bacterium]